MRAHLPMAWPGWALAIALCQSSLLASDLVLTATADNSSYLADEAIKITWSIDNRGSTPVTFDHRSERMTMGYKFQRLQPNPSLLRDSRPPFWISKGPTRGPNSKSLAPANLLLAPSICVAKAARPCPGNTACNSTSTRRIRDAGIAKGQNGRSAQLRGIRVLRSQRADAIAGCTAAGDRAEGGNRDLAGALVEKPPQPLPLYWNPSRRKSLPWKH